METYSLLREFADSWFMLAIFAFFLGTVAWALRPGGRRQHEDAAQIPFRHEDQPARDDALAASADNLKEARQ